MFSNLSDRDRLERDAIIADIRAAFAEVVRGNDAVSWSECYVIDGYGSESEREDARQSDRESHWSELIDDPEWEPFPGMGGFCFINAEGFLYYLPPAMIRILSGRDEEGFPGQLLQSIDRFTDSQSSLRWSEAQRQSIARFISFMARHDDEVRFQPEEPNPWVEALARRWGAYLPESS